MSLHNYCSKLISVATFNVSTLFPFTVTKLAHSHQIWLDPLFLNAQHLL